jgi:hypothetical protein
MSSDFINGDFTCENHFPVPRSASEAAYRRTSKKSTRTNHSCSPLLCPLLLLEGKSFNIFFTALPIFPGSLPGLPESSFFADWRREPLPSHHTRPGRLPASPFSSKSPGGRLLGCLFSLSIAPRRSQFHGERLDAKKIKCGTAFGAHILR